MFNHFPNKCFNMKEQIVIVRDNTWETNSNVAKCNSLYQSVTLNLSHVHDKICIIGNLNNCSLVQMWTSITFISRDRLSFLKKPHSQENLLMHHEAINNQKLYFFYLLNLFVSFPCISRKLGWGFSCYNLKHVLNSPFHGMISMGSDMVSRSRSIYGICVLIWRKFIGKCWRG